MDGLQAKGSGLMAALRDNGKPDGQLSVAGILELPADQWPTLIERDGFADLAGVTLNLSGPESAVFRRICFRAGSASQGCWEISGINGAVSQTWREHG